MVCVVAGGEIFRATPGFKAFKSGSRERPRIEGSPASFPLSVGEGGDVLSKIFEKTPLGFARFLMGSVEGKRRIPSCVQNLCVPSSYVELHFGQ